MKAEEFKEIQAPLKEKYRNSPESALITLRASGNLNEEISCSIETGKAMAEAGLHAGTGGSGLLACSGDLLLEALVACAGVTLRAVSTSMGLNITQGCVLAEGDLDFRGTLGVSREAPVGFKKIRLFFDLDSREEPDKLEQLIKLTKRYCVVYQTLLNGVEVEMLLKN